ncbi:MAG: 23S rRNA (pseudouridine(1915)-N(3))-methyltransferase RlmH [candidate division Zixibacteria bacterium]|nr:23S rRNA (pseudouridine(1915)-N(3))-methyltransferase RlmH [candidate division Zixibacteria bacterium]
MFHVRIIAVGKNKDHWVDDAIAHYSTLLKKYASVELICTADVKKTKNIPETEVMKREAPLIRTCLGATFTIALTEKGRSMDSRTLAKELNTLMQKHGGCDIIIGGAYGLDKTLLAECDDRLSLSPLTMSHQLVRPVLMEQLYRAFSILAGGKYHK